MYGPLPATGGGWLLLPAAGLIIGGALNSIIIIGISVVLTIIIIAGMVRLRRGEAKIAERDRK